MATVAWWVHPSATVAISSLLSSPVRAEVPHEAGERDLAAPAGFAAQAPRSCRSGGAGGENQFPWPSHPYRSSARPVSRNPPRRVVSATLSRIQHSTNPLIQKGSLKPVTIDARDAHVYRQILRWRLKAPNNRSRPPIVLALPQHEEGDGRDLRPYSFSIAAVEAERPTGPKSRPSRSETLIKTILSFVASRRRQNSQCRAYRGSFGILRSVNPITIPKASSRLIVKEFAPSNSIL
jgi:hypothetical protein